MTFFVVLFCPMFKRLARHLTLMEIDGFSFLNALIVACVALVNMDVVFWHPIGSKMLATWENIRLMGKNSINGIQKV